MAKYTLAENIQRVRQSLQERFKAGKQAGEETMRNDFFGTKTDWSYFCYKGSNIDIIKKLTTNDFRNAQNISYMFAASSSVGDFDDIDQNKKLSFPKAVTAQGMFYCSNLISLYSLVMPKCKNAKNLFRDSKKLEQAYIAGTAPEDFESAFGKCENLWELDIDLTNAKTLKNTFCECTNLEYLNCLGVISEDINLQWSTKLTVASLISLIKNLKDYSGTAKAHTRTITLSSDSWGVLANSSSAADELGFDWDMITCAQDVVTAKGWNWA